MPELNRLLTKEPFWAMTVPDSIALLKSSHHLGISGVEASARENVFGKNKIVTQKRFVGLKIFLRQFTSPLIYILVIAGIVTTIFEEYKDAAFIFTAVAINAFLGFYQEHKAEKALDGLADYLEKKTRVVRDGRIKEIDVEDLVPGDVVNLSGGDSVPADCRIVEADNLFVDEAILTGESLPAEKNARAVSLRAGLGDRKSMVFSGTSVVEGVCSALVVSTGGDTELGAMASLLAGIKDEATPLQKTINSLAEKLTVMILVMTLLIFALGLVYEYSVLEMFKMAVAVAVGAVPEGLAISMTVILAVGVERLAKRKGIVRRLTSAETLGDTSVILTDKTGTLTEAKMELIRVEAPMAGEQADVQDYLRNILKFAILCTDARVLNPEAEVADWKFVGKPLDTALIKGAAKNFGLREFDIRDVVIIKDRLPFNSQNKFSAVRIKEGNAETTLVIGAPEVVLKICHTFYWNGKKQISDDERAEILKEVNKNANEGYRMISVAASERLMDLKDIKKIDGFAYMGNILLKDPIRKDVGSAIREIEREGIKTVILTGDHTGTAISVAHELGMQIDKNSVIEQHELDLLDDEELLPKLSSVKVFSRINPQSKVRITQMFQKLGHVVAMTGDGVNDAPALKQADVGIAIGSGSGVARESADLILLDDSFHTIVAAIDEGRRILQNIRKVLVFCLTSLFDEIILIGGSILLNIPIPLGALQILWVNFIADSFPAIALSYEDEKDKGDIIRAKISRVSVFDGEVKFLVWVVGVLSSALFFALYYLLLYFDVEENLSKTFIFASFGVYTLFLSFSIKSLDKNIWKYNPFTNRFMNISFVVGTALMAFSVYNPFMQNLLHTISLPGVWLAAVLLVSAVCVVMVEAGKFIFLRRRTVSIAS